MVGQIPVEMHMQKKILCFAFLLTLQSDSASVAADDDASEEMSAAFRQYHQDMFNRFPVVFVFDDDSSGPIVNPSDFALGGTVCHAEARDGLSLPEKFKTLDTREEVAEFAKWCNDVRNSGGDGPDAQQTGSKLEQVLGWLKNFELAPDRDKLSEWREPQHAIRMNREAVANGKGLFGAVGLFAHSKDYKRFYRYVTYMMFFAYNKAKGPLGWGDHEGDWICVDLLVEGEKEMKLLGAFFHQHGKKTFVPAGQLQYDKNGAILVFLEKESNEPFPKPGPAQVIHLDFELGPNRIVADYELVRSHMGGGMKYSSKGKVVDISSNVQTLNARLMHGYPGQWGEDDKDPAWTKKVIGDVTNPPSPPWQEKMWTHTAP